MCCIQTIQFFFFGIGIPSLVSVVGISVYYYSHMKFEKEIVLNIHCFSVEIQHKNQRTKEPRGEEVERELKHRERNDDEDLMCRPRAEMNAPPLEQSPPHSRALPPIPAPSHPPPIQRTRRGSFSLSHVCACPSKFLPLR